MKLVGGELNLGISFGFTILQFPMKIAWGYAHRSLRLIQTTHNLTQSVNTICEAVLICFFWAPNNGLDKLPEICFVFPFNLTSKLTMAFLTDQPRRVLLCILKSCYTAGGLERGFWCQVSQMDLTRSLVPSVAQAMLIVVSLAAVFWMSCNAPP